LIRISDSGLGLSAADLDRIFEAFSQAAPCHGGLGLGLTIARQLLDQLGGSILASSPGVGKGTTFEIELPLVPSATSEACDAGMEKPRSIREGRSLFVLAPPSRAQLHRRVLLVEDHEPTRVTLEKLLARCGFEMLSAGSVAEARAVASGENFDLVLSDLNLPDGDGCELFEELCATRPELSGVALSGHGMDEDIHRSREAGFAGHLTKPVDLETLAGILASLFEKRGSKTVAHGESPGQREAQNPPLIPLEFDDPQGWDGRRANAR